MEFRRINGLPPYVFAQINGLKAEARAAGRDIVDFGFGNPERITVTQLVVAFQTFASQWQLVTKRCGT